MYRRLTFPNACGLLIALAVVLATAPAGAAHPASTSGPDNSAGRPVLRYGGSFTATAHAGRPAAQDEVLVLDTYSGAPRLSVTGGLPRSVMGDPFDAADPGSPLKITRVELYLASTAHQTYSNGLCARIQFWNDFNIAASPVFSEPAGRVYELRVDGPVSLTPNVYMVISGALVPGAPLADLMGNVVVVNFQGDNGSGCADSDTLTALLRYVEEPAEAPIAVGAVPLAPPHLGYYRNASGRADLNFEPADLRWVAGTNSNAVAMRLYASAPSLMRSLYLPLIVRS
jgi:hypothetical protein